MTESEPRGKRQKTDYQRKRDNAHKAAWRKARYWNCIEAGLCVKCGKQPAVPGRRKCAECIEIIHEERRREAQIIINRGVCVKCGKPLKTSMYCKDCARKDSLRVLSYYYKAKGVNADA